MLVVVQWEEEDLFRGGSRQCPKDREKMTLTIFYGRGREKPLSAHSLFSPWRVGCRALVGTACRVTAQCQVREVSRGASDLKAV